MIMDTGRVKYRLCIFGLAKFSVKVTINPSSIWVQCYFTRGERLSSYEWRIFNEVCLLIMSDSDWRQILNINGNCAQKNHGCRVQFLKELGGPSSKIVAKKKYNDLSFSIPFHPPGWNRRTRNLPSVSSLSIYMLRDWKKKCCDWPLLVKSISFSR